MKKKAIGDLQAKIDTRVNRIKEYTIKVNQARADRGLGPVEVSTARLWNSSS